MADKAQGCDSPLPLLLHQLLLSPSWTALQAHWSSCCSSHVTAMYLRQDLSTCCSRYFTSFRSLLKYPLLREAFFSHSVLSATQYKVLVHTPSTLRPSIIFFITLITTTQFIFNCHFPLYPWECKLHKDKSWLTIPEQASSFENSRRLANAPPLLFRWDSNYPTIFLATMLLPSFCTNHSTSSYFQNWTISVPSIHWALAIFRKEHLKWNKLWKAFWQSVSKHWRQQSDSHQCYVQVSPQAGSHMPFVITGATWFKLFGLGMWQWVRQATGAKWLIIFSLPIAGSFVWFSHSGNNI